MKNLAALLLPSMLLASGQVAAFQPFATDDTGTQGASGNQFELALGRDRAATAGEHDDRNQLALGFTRGLGDTVDAYLGVSYRWGANAAGASGFDSAALGVKWRFHEDEASGLSVAIKPEISVPLISQDRGGPPTAASVTLVMSREAKAWGIHVNLGFGTERHPDPVPAPDATIYSASVAPVWNVGADWKVGFELGTSLARAGGASARTDMIGLGAVYSPNPDCDLALGVSSSADNASPRTTTHAATAGITCRFK